MNFCVYGAAGNDMNPDYIKETERLGQHMAQQGITLVFGGGAGGMMGAAARGVKEGGGSCIAVVPRFFHVDGILFENRTETIYTDTMRERKQIMEEKSDGFIVAPGGIGTMDEFFEIFTLRSLGRHNKPIALFNVKGFYDELLALLHKAEKSGFIRPGVLDLLIVDSNPESLLERLMEQISGKK